MVRIFICLAVRSYYVADFVDVGTVALAVGQMLSSIHLVRIWVSCGVIGSGRKLIAGLVRHGNTTDMQVSWLSDEERCRPWDQLLKVGTEATLSRCKQALSVDVRNVEGVTVDEYRSAVCARLENLETDVNIPIRGKQKQRSGRPSAFSYTVSDDEPLVSFVVQGVKPRNQGDVAIRGNSKAAARTRGVCSRMSPSGRNRGVRRSNPKMPVRSCGKRTACVLSTSDSSGPAAT